MTVQTTQRRSGGGYLERPAPSGLADVIEIILDKGIVIDAYIRVSLVGIEILTIDARIVIASVDTYLRFAEATNRLDLSDKGGRPLADLAAEGAGAAVEKVAGGVVERKVDRTLDKVGDGFKITRILLKTSAEVPGIDETKFREFAEGAKKGCPVSQALAGTDIRLGTTLKS